MILHRGDFLTANDTEKKIHYEKYVVSQPNCTSINACIILKKSKHCKKTRHFITINKNVNTSEGYWLKHGSIELISLYRSDFFFLPFFIFSNFLHFLYSYICPFIVLLFTAKPHFG